IGAAFLSIASCSFLRRRGTATGRTRGTVEWNHGKAHLGYGDNGRIRTGRGRRSGMKHSGYFGVSMPIGAPGSPGAGSARIARSAHSGDEWYCSLTTGGLNTPASSNVGTRYAVAWCSFRRIKTSAQVGHLNMAASRLGASASPQRISVHWRRRSSASRSLSSSEKCTLDSSFPVIVVTISFVLSVGRTQLFRFASPLPPVRPLLQGDGRPCQQSASEDEHRHHAQG